MSGPIAKEGGPADPNNPNPAGDGNNSGTQPTGQDPKKPANGSDANQFDPSSLSDDAFGKVFDDPRAWNHPRFKQLNERAKQGADALEKLKEIEEQKLVSEKKFEELANTKGQEAADWKAKYETEIVNRQIVEAATKLGAASTNLVLKAVDRSLIKVTNDGVAGIEEAVMKLKESEPVLFGTPASPSLGSGTNPGGSPNTKRFKMSDIQKPEFYQENNKDGEIDRAMAEGNIEMDIPMMGIQMTPPK